MLFIEKIMKKGKGKIEEESELLLVLKTKKDLIKELNEEVKKIHPYEVFELIFIDITTGNPPYLEWILKTVK